MYQSNITVKKRLFYFFMITFLIGTAYTEDKISILNDKVTFSIPSTPEIINEQNYQGSIFLIREKIRVNGSFWDESDFLTMEDSVFSPIIIETIKNADYNICKDDIKPLLLNTEIPLLTVFDEGEKALLYEKIEYDGEVVGELIFYIPPINYSWDEGSLLYSIKIVIDGYIIIIDVYLKNFIVDYPHNFPQYFELIAGKYFWKNEAGMNEFSRDLNNKNYRKFPSLLKQFRETKDMILATLEINE